MLTPKRKYRNKPFHFGFLNQRFRMFIEVNRFHQYSTPTGVEPLLFASFFYKYLTSLRYKNHFRSRLKDISFELILTDRKLDFSTIHKSYPLTRQLRVPRQYAQNAQAFRKVEDCLIRYLDRIKIASLPKI